MFVDEFQNTTPAQTEILRILAETGTTTGVIGDLEQSIFTFAGANPEDLLEFAPEGKNTYHTSSNRRSTGPILDLLNRIREGPEQNRYGHAVKTIYRALRTKNGRLTDNLFSGSSAERKTSRDKRQRTAASLLPYLLKRHERHRELSGLDFYLDVREHMTMLPLNASLTRPTTRGEFGQLLDETSYKTLFVTAELKSGAGDVKTIEHLTTAAPTSWGKGIAHPIRATFPPTAARPTCLRIEKPVPCTL